MTEKTLSLDLLPWRVAGMENKINRKEGIVLMHKHAGHTNGFEHHNWRETVYTENHVVRS